MARQGASHDRLVGELHNHNANGCQFNVGRLFFMVAYYPIFVALQHGHLVYYSPNFNE